MLYDKTEYFLNFYPQVEAKPKPGPAKSFTKVLQIIISDSHIHPQSVDVIASKNIIFATKPRT